MINIIKSKDRGYFDHNWLQTYHTFSFGDYVNPQMKQYSHLRVMNEDVIHPEAGFPLHPHRDMEILTYIINGTITHADSMGNSAEIAAGDIQIMSAGSGIRHSESNTDPSVPIHLYQIWIFPNKKGLPPRHETKSFPKESKLNKWCPIVSPTGGSHALQIYQDTTIFLTELEKEKSLTVESAPGRQYWLQIINGTVEINGITTSSGDGIATHAEDLTIVAREDSSIMFFDLPIIGQ